jgi:hypothetical protein
MTALQQQSHGCPVKGCEERIQVDQVMCETHWQLVSADLRLALYGASGDTRGASDSLAEAVRRCIEAVETSQLLYQLATSPPRSPRLVRLRAVLFGRRARVAETRLERALLTVLAWEKAGIEIPDIGPICCKCGQRPPDPGYPDCFPCAVAERPEP